MYMTITIVMVTFVFVCRVQDCCIRTCRRERDGTKGRIRKVPDCVLIGEVDIEVRNLGASREIWYKLGEYTCQYKDRTIKPFLV